MYWSSQKYAMICLEIMTRPLHVDPKRVESPKERWEELKNGVQRCQSDQNWMNNGGEKRWNVIVIYDTFNFYW